MRNSIALFSTIILKGREKPRGLYWMLEAVSNCSAVSRVDETGVHDAAFVCYYAAFFKEIAEHIEHGAHAVPARFLLEEPDIAV